MYKYLLWDVDGTALDFLAAEAGAIRALFGKYQLGECGDEKLREYSRINAKYWKALERGEMTKPQILVGRFREFFAAQGIDPDLAEAFNRDYQTTLGEYAVFIPHAEETLRAQKGKYTLIAATNGTRIAQERKLQCSGLDQVFDAVFISEMVGAEKPSPDFYCAVFQQVGIQNKAQALIIGDSLTSDMRGGLNFGVDTCWYNPDHTPPDPDIPVTYEIDDLRALSEILQNT